MKHLKVQVQVVSTGFHVRTWNLWEAQSTSKKSFNFHFLNLHHTNKWDPPTNTSFSFIKISFNGSIELPSDTGSDGLTTEHGGGVDQTVDPGGGGVIFLKVQLELHKEHGNTSEYRDGGEVRFSAFLYI